MNRVLRLLHALEDAALVSLLASMIVLACTQILMRNLFDEAFLWIDPLLRAMVLWLGLLGALVASRRSKHIAIDILNRYVPAHWRRYVLIANGAFTAAVCAVIAFHGWRFVGMEFTDQAIAFAGVPAWLLEAVIPFTFALIACRYVLHAISALRGNPVEP